MVKHLISHLAFLSALVCHAHEFTYEYMGQTLSYSIISEDEHTCRVSQATNLSGYVEIPAMASYNDQMFTVTEIEDYAFQNCLQLFSVSIPQSVTRIGKGAFYGCQRLVSIEIPPLVNEIEEYTFYLCSSLTSLKIGNAVSNIGDLALAYCSNITSLHLPNSLKSIGNESFAHCSSLNNLQIPAATISIGTQAFLECTNMLAFVVDSNNKYYSSLNGVLFNKDYSLLIRCPGAICEYSIPDFVREIESKAFYRSPYLTHLDIPASVSSIGEEAFSGCPNLDIINVDVSNEFYCSDDNVLFDKSRTTLIQMASTKMAYDIPATVEIIGKGAFMNSCLRTVYIPASVSSIGDKAFFNCILGGVYLNSQKPPILSPSAFDDDKHSSYIYHTADLFVPHDAYQTFMAAYPWNLFRILKYTYSGNNNPVPDIETNNPVEIYSIDGRLLNHSKITGRQGLYVIRQGSKVQKVVR